MKIKSEGSSPDTAFDLRLSKKNRIKLHIERIILLNEFIGLQTVSFAESPSIVKSPKGVPRIADHIRLQIRINGMVQALYCWLA